MIDKKYCMSSYLAFRYIEKEDADFFEGLHHELIKPAPEEEKIPVTAADEIDAVIGRVFDGLKGKRLGLLLSGGMDSAILAHYMEGCDAYTFRFMGGELQKEELARAEYYAKRCGMKLHYVEIDWNTVKDNLTAVMRRKAAPVHSIEPQLYQAAMQAKKDGIEHLIVGESADLLFGGMDRLLSKDWTFEGFMERYIFTKPEDVLKEYEDMSYLFERYRMGEAIDFLKFMDDVFSVESSSSYLNAFAAATMPYTDPYAKLKMAEPLDLYRVRHGEPKYLIRELFAKKYPELPVPDKIAMPRPVSVYFARWKGPERPEFKENLDMDRFTGDQKWQMYCLEEFLNMYDGPDAGKGQKS